MSSHTTSGAGGIDRDGRPRHEGCTECGGDLREEDGETFCADCGCVVDEYRIDHGPEWRQYDEKERRRTGLPMTEARHDRGLHTEIGRFVDGNGKPLSEGRRRTFNRLQGAHRRSIFRSKAERNLAHGFTDVMRLVSALDLPYEVKDRACSIFREAQAERLLPGRSIDSMAAASVYAACRCLGLPWQVEEIVEYSHVDLSRVRSAYRALQRELELPARTIQPRSYVPRLASATEVPDVVSHRALELAREAEEAGLGVGRHPAGVAAACLYHASVETGCRVTRSGTLTQQVIADHAGVTPVTLRTNWHDLKELGHA